MSRPAPLPDAVPAPAAPVSPRAWIGLAVLTGINLLNYLDRYVVPPLGESLRTSPLHVSDAQFGLLTSAFVFVYMLTAPVFGVLGDRGPRSILVATGVGIWSIATALGGLAESWHALLGARALVGIGEAAYGSIAPALLADYFPERLRGRVFATMYMAIPVGSALGYVVGGVTNAHLGWRPAFFVAAAPGAVFALLALRLWDAPRGARDDASSVAPGVRAYAMLTHLATYRRTILGYAAYTFALGGIVAWMPTFLTRVRGLPGERASVTLGAVLIATGFVGTFAGGWITDWLRTRVSRAGLWLSGGATVLAAPFAWLAFAVASPAVYWSAIVAAELLVFVSTGPINEAIVDVVPSHLRASAMALSILTIHLLGDVPSPWLIGVVSEHASLERAVLLVPAAILVGGAVWVWAAATPPRE